MNEYDSENKDSLDKEVKKKFIRDVIIILVIVMATWLFSWGAAGFKLSFFIPGFFGTIGIVLLIIVPILYLFEVLWRKEIFQKEDEKYRAMKLDRKDKESIKILKKSLEFSKKSSKSTYVILIFLLIFTIIILYSIGFLSSATGENESSHRFAISLIMVIFINILIILTWIYYYQTKHKLDFWDKRMKNNKEKI